MSSSTSERTVTVREEKGRVFSFLPLPVRSGLAVQTHASFALSSNRRALWSDSEWDPAQPLLAEEEMQRRLGAAATASGGVGSDASLSHAALCDGLDMSAAKARWNHILLAFTLAPLVGKLLLRMRSLGDLKNAAQPSAMTSRVASSLYRRWPNERVAESPFDLVASCAIDHIVRRNLPLLWAPLGSNSARSGAWIGPQQAVFADQCFVDFCTSLPADADTALRCALLEAGVFVCDPPSGVRASLQRTGHRLRTTAPEHLANALRDALAPLCKGASCAASQCPSWWTPLAVCTFVKYCLLPQHASAPASNGLDGTAMVIDSDVRLHRGVDALDGLPIIPLGSPLAGESEAAFTELGVFASPMAGVAERRTGRTKILYTVSSISFANMLRGCDFIAYPAEVVNLLCAHRAHAAGRFNLRPLTPRALVTQGGLALMLPPAWKNKQIVVLASRTDEVRGAQFDIARAIVVARAGAAGLASGGTTSQDVSRNRITRKMGRSTTGKAKKGRGKAQEKARRKAERAAAKRMRGALHSSRGIAPGAVIEEEIVSAEELAAAAARVGDPSWRDQALQAMLRPVDEVAALKAMLRSLWDFVDSASPSHWHARDAALFKTCEWPIVVTGEGMVCTVAFARDRRVVAAAQYSSYVLELMRRFGCLTCPSAPSTAAGLVPSGATLSSRSESRVSSADDGDDEAGAASDSADAVITAVEATRVIAEYEAQQPQTQLQRLGELALTTRTGACEAIAASFEWRPLTPLSRAACLELRTLILRWKNGQADPLASAEMSVVSVDGKLNSDDEDESAAAVEYESVWTQISRGRRRARSITDPAAHMAQITVDVSAHVVRRLPLFDTISNEMFAPIVSFDFDRALRTSNTIGNAATPGGAVKPRDDFNVSVAPANFEDDSESDGTARHGASGLSSTSSWSALLKPAYPHSILACALPLERAMLRCAGVTHRPSALRFIADFLVPRVLASEKAIDAAPELRQNHNVDRFLRPPQALCIAILEAVGRSGICGKRNTAGGREKALKTALVHFIDRVALVVIEQESYDGSSNVVERRRCSDFVDPGDGALSTILDVLRQRSASGVVVGGSSEEANLDLTQLLSLAPPEVYSSNKYVLAAMRYCGSMRSLRDPECFITVARGVATVKIAELGLHLLQFLVDNQSHAMQRWTSQHFATIGKIAWIPAFDMRKLACLTAKSLAASCDAHTNRTVDKFHNLSEARRRYEKQWQRNRRPMGKSGKKKRRGGGGGGAGAASRMLAGFDDEYRDDFYHDDADHSASGSDASPWVDAHRPTASAAPPWSNVDQGRIMAEARSYFARELAAEERSPNRAAEAHAAWRCWISLDGRSIVRESSDADEDEEADADADAGKKIFPQVCLHVDRAITWRAATILPAKANHLSPSFLKRWGIAHPPPAATVFSHIARLGAECLEVALGENSREISIGLSIDMLRGLALISIGGVNRLLQCGRVTPAAARRALGSVHFIPAALPPVTTGSSKRSRFIVASPSSFCTDLEESLGERALCIPPFLSKLGLVAILSTLGASSAAHVSAPRVKITSPDPAADLPERVRSAYNVRDLADLHFLVSDIEGGGPDRIVYAHRLIVGLSCPTLFSMVTRGGGGGGGSSVPPAARTRNTRGGGDLDEDLMSDEELDDGELDCAAAPSNDASVRTLRLPPWVGYDAARMYVQYLYVGRISGRRGGDDAMPLYPPTAESAQAVCTLLRLADSFLQPHLKELCELYLSADDIVGVYNVLDLLTHAVECRAEQLKVVCLHKARQMHAVVSRTESWTELAPELRELVTNIHADAR